MDEYIYLSDRKVAQFLPDTPAPWWRRLRAKKVTAGVGLGIVKTDVEVEQRDPESLTHAQLEKVAAAIDENCPWYEEPVRAGDWAFFEGRLGVHLAAEGPAAGAVLFYDVAPSNGARRVLLHGSATHLRDRPVSPGPAASPGVAGARPARGFSTAESFPLVVRSADEALASRPEHASLPDLLAGLLRHRPRSRPDELGGHVAALFGHVDGSDWYTATAPYVAAVLRVTTVLRPAASGFETLVGSPLFIRSVRP